MLFKMVYQHLLFLFARNDNRALDWSQADQCLSNLFAGDGMPLHAFYGDAMFVGQRDCFRTRHVPLVQGAPLHPVLARKNHAMLCVREEIEHCYGFLRDLWELAEMRRLFRLGDDPVIVVAEIRMMFLLTNIFTCFCHGNTTSSVFGLLPPSIDQCLN